MLAIFEVDAVDVERFYLNALNFSIEDVGLVILESEQELFKFRDRHSCSSVPSFSLETYLCDPRKIGRLLLSYKISHILLSSHQIPYQFIILTASLAGIKTIYVQHGLYIPFMRREYSFFLNKFAKACRYLFIVAYLSLYLKDVKVFIQVAASQIFGTRRPSYIEHPLLFPTHSLVFSRYWGEWHQQYYLFSDVNMHIIGSHDLRIHSLDYICFESDIVYCYQTLVEDGRITLDTMNQFYTILAQYASEYSLRVIVKSHPRADPELINRLSTYYGFSINSESTPDGSIVIGHYSSMLAFWGYFGRKILAISLPGHPIPESISQWCTTSFMHIPPPNDIQKPDLDILSYYFGPICSTRDVLGIIANIVLKDGGCL